MSCRYCKAPLFALLLLLLAACQTAPTPAPTVTLEATPGSTIPVTPPSASTRVARPTFSITPSRTRPAPSRNQFVYLTSNGSLSLHDPTSRVLQTILKATRQEFYSAPSFSPDGSQIVFTATAMTAAGIAGNEIQVINTDGTNKRTLFKAPPTGAQISFGNPRYAPDGSSIYFSIVVAGAAPRDYKLLVVRGAASGGEWQTVLENAYMPSPSADGRLLVFLRSNLETFATSLWVANADGTEARQLLADDVFSALAGPRFSPDGQWIVIATSGTPQKPLPTSQHPSALSSVSGIQVEQGNCAIWFWFICLVSRAYANGLPWELWLVRADGKSFKQLTRLALDSPWPAFSKDGRSIGFMTVEGTFEYDRETNRVNKLSNQSGHGVMDWFQN